MRAREAMSHRKLKAAAFVCAVTASSLVVLNALGQGDLRGAVGEVVRAPQQIKVVAQAKPSRAVRVSNSNRRTTNRNSNSNANSDAGDEAEGLNSTPLMIAAADGDAAAVASLI